MEKDGCSILMVVVSAAFMGLVVAGTAGAQILMSPSHSPQPGVDCSDALLTAVNCLDYVSSGSNLTSPSSVCCSGMKNLLTSKPVCLCQLIANSGSSGFPIDRKRALGLPNACKFSAPPVSACSLLGVPIASPPEAPAPAKSGGRAAAPSGPPAAPSGPPASPSGPPASPSPSPAGGAAGPDCSGALADVVGCLDYVSAGSNSTSPGSGCCSGLYGLITKSPVCLCQLLSNGADAGFRIDRKRALGLPNACNFSAPPVSSCASLGVPVAVPSEAPSSVTSELPTQGSPSSASGGSESATGAPPGKSSSRGSSFGPSALMLTIAAAIIVTGATVAVF